MKSSDQIPLEQIDFLDDFFSINYMPDLQELRSSIQAVGLLQPISLRRKSGGYRIVSGFRRAFVMKELGKSEIESRIFEEEEINNFQLFSLALHENRTTRGFNVVEQAIALDKLIRLFEIPADTVIQSYLPLLSLEPNEKILKTYLALAQMEEEVKAYVLKENVSRGNIRKLSALSHEERMTLLDFLSRLKLGENRLREVLAYLEEISKRDHSSLQDILRNKEIQSVLCQEDLTPSHKAEHIKKVLLSLRFPKKHQLERAFDQKKKELNLPPNLLLTHRPFFEGKGLGVEMQFDSIEEYKKLLNALSDLADKKEFEELLKDT